MHRDNVQRTARVYFALPVMSLLDVHEGGSLPEHG